MTSSLRSRLDAVRRELAFATDERGLVTWADERASSRLGAAQGTAIERLVAPGTEARARALIDAAVDGGCTGWEIPFVVDGAIATLLVDAHPSEGGVLLVCNEAPEAYLSAATQLGEALAEIAERNREVARQRKELGVQRDELLELNDALRDSNRGVLTLHAELEDRADALQRAADIRSRVVANVGHEFRTPLHTVLGLSRLLMDQVDGPLTPEQLKQVRFIRTAAEELTEMVDDLLDLSKIEAGKMNLRVERFSLGEFLGAMRGMLRPTVPADSAVELIFDVSGADVELETDRAKLSQVLRNLVSNALKFTESGSVVVSACAGADGLVAFSVRDTGIGILAADLERIFEEFGQIDNVLQRKVKGTGLGLPLSRRLAELLGGRIDVESEPGSGSCFTVTVPQLLPEVAEFHAVQERGRNASASRAPVLLVEDDRKTVFLYERYLAAAGIPVLAARSVADAEALLRERRPAAIVLDIVLEGESTWDFLGRLKRDPATCDIPVLVVTVTNREQKARALGADEFWLKPLDQDRLLRKLRSLSERLPARVPSATVLAIDDDEKARYLLRRQLAGTPFRVIEAASGNEGIQLARTERPDVILLDFLLDGMTAFDVLDQLKADALTRPIPVIINTSHTLDSEQRERLSSVSEVILSKEELSRELAIHRIRDALEKAGVGIREKE